MRKRLKKKLMQHPKNLYAHYKAFNDGKQPPTPMKPPRRSSGRSWYSSFSAIYCDLMLVRWEINSYYFLSSLSLENIYEKQAKENEFDNNNFKFEPVDPLKLASVESTFREQAEDEAYQEYLDAIKKYLGMEMENEKKA